MDKRLFKLWYYTVSHRQMLLRSMGNIEVCNLDIYFGDVLYVEMPVIMDEMEILKTTQEDIDYIAQKIDTTNKIVTVLKSGEHKYFVVSSVMKIMENNLSMFEMPFDIPDYTMCDSDRNS